MKMIMGSTTSPKKKTGIFFCNLHVGYLAELNMTVEYSAWNKHFHLFSKCFLCFASELSQKLMKFKSKQLFRSLSFFATSV